MHRVYCLISKSFLNSNFSGFDIYWFVNSKHDYFNIFICYRRSINSNQSNHEYGGELNMWWSSLNLRHSTITCTLRLYYKQITIINVYKSFHLDISFSLLRWDIHLLDISDWLSNIAFLSTILSIKHDPRLWKCYKYKCWILHYKRERDLAKWIKLNKNFQSQCNFILYICINFISSNECIDISHS